MLTPEYLDVCAEDLAELYRQLDESVVQIVAARIAKTDFVSDSSQWQIEKLQQAGMTYDEVIAAIAQYTQKSEDEVEEMFKEAGVKTIATDNEIFQKAGLATTGIKQSAAMTQLLRAGLAKTNGKLRNLTLTTALTAQTAYLNACDLAYMQIASGALSMPEAVRYAVQSAAKQGTQVRYPSGHSDQLDVAVRRSAVTGVNQTCAEIQLANAENMGCNLVEVTAHIGARPTHAEWQGGVYMISGSSRQYRNLEEATGYGTGDGLCGWNCRHNFFPFFEGIDLRTYRDDYLEKLKNDGYYEAEQKQRYYERKVRETRRELSGYDSAIKAAQTPEQVTALKQEFDRASVKLKKQEATLKDWCQSNNLVYDSNRVQTYYGKGTTQGFNRSVSQKAVWANRKSLQNIEKGRTIIKQRISGGEYSTKISHQQYLKHVEGTKQFDDYAASRKAKGHTPQSKLTISEKEAQDLIIKLAGTGMPYIDSNGNIGNNEFVDCGYDIGEYYENNAYLKTSRASIYYGKKGSHIVPIKPKE